MLNRANRWRQLGLLALLTAMIAALHDVKERYQRLNREYQKMEAALRSRQDFIEQIAATAPSIIYVYDLVEERNVWVNRQAQAILGYTAREIQAMGNRLLLDTLDPEDVALLVERNQKLDAAADGEVVATEYRARHKNGEWRWLYSRDVVIERQPDQRAARILGVAVDITDRRKAEERAQLLQVLTAHLAQAMTPQAVAQAVAGQIMSALGAHLAAIALKTDNDTLQLLNTVGIPEPIALNFRNTPLSFALPLTDAARLGVTVVVETRADYIRRYPAFAEILDNVTHSQSSIALPLKDGDGVIGSIGFSFLHSRKFSPEDLALFEAVSQQCAQALVRAQLYEAERQAREQAEHADQIKLKFLGMVSHELRTPLTSVKGFATTLLADDVQFTPEQQRQFLEIISQEADKLTELVEQLLNLTQLQAGNLLIVPRCQDFSVVLDMAAPQLAMLTGLHQLTVNQSPDLPRVYVDERRIVQVLVNLVGNAVKFSPPGTQIQVSAFPANGGVEVDVADEGQGIPLEAHAYIFEAFRQVEQRTVLSRGAGLGLAICKGLIESHKGRIWIKLRETQGTTIAFWLPAAPGSLCKD